MRILFVCSGNTCRSPMAEWILKKEIQQLNAIQMEIASAGIATISGLPMSPLSQAVLKANGYEEAETFRSSTIDRESLDQWDYILTMTKGHLRAILMARPDLKERIGVLAEFSAGGNQEIEDPYGGDLSDYQRAFEHIKESIEGLVQFLKQNHPDQSEKTGKEPEDEDWIGK